MPLGSSPLPLYTGQTALINDWPFFMLDKEHPQHTPRLSSQVRDPVYLSGLDILGYSLFERQSAYIC